jgi:hypothetical protein
MICSVSIRPSPSVGSVLLLNTEVGWIHGGLEGLIYGLRAPESRRALLRRGWALGLSWSQRSQGHRSAPLL